MRWRPLALRRIARLSILLLAFFDVPALAQPPRARAAELFEELWRTSGAPGASVAIARDGEMLFTAGIGYAELEPLRWRQALMWRIRTDGAGRDFVHACGQVKGFNACVVIYVEEGVVAATADNADAFGFHPALELVDVFRSRPEAEETGR